MNYIDFVDDRFGPYDEWEEEPFCPFHTPECMGYCDAAYTHHCYGCPESLGEYFLEHCVNGEEMYRRLRELAESVTTHQRNVELANELLADAISCE